MAVGEDFALRLASTPTTGYRWIVADPPPDPDVVALVDDSFEPPSSARPGAAGTQVFRLRGTGPGSTAVGLRQARSWEKASAAGADALFDVTVSP